jgi:hypothetical protein
VAAAPAAAPGALARVVVPYQLVLGTVDVQGHARLPGAPGSRAVQADFTLTGGDLSPGREGTLHLQAKMVDASVAARVGALQARVDLILRQSLLNNFDRVGLNALVDATGPALSGQHQLRLSAELLRATNGENYRVRLDTVRAGAVENLLNLTALLPTASQTYRGEWSLTARSEQVEPFFLGGALPRFDLRGSGAFSFNPAAPAMTLQGGLQGQVGELEALRPALRAIGSVRLDGKFDCALEQGVARLNLLDLTVTGAQPVLTLHVGNAAAFHLREKRFDLGPAAPGELLRLKLLGLPLAWIRPFVTAADVSGGQLTGELAVRSAGGDKVLLQTDGPLKLSDANVVKGGRLLLAHADAELDLAAELTGSGFSSQLRSLTLHTPAGDKLSLQGTVSGPLGASPALGFAGAFEADLPKLLGPWLPGLYLRAQGQADATWQAPVLQLRRLELEAKDGHGRMLSTASLLQPFALDLQKFQTGSGAGEVELAKVAFGDMDLSSLPLAATGYALGGQAGHCEYVLLSHAGQLQLRARAPVRLTGLAVSRSGQPLLDQLTLELSPAIELTGRVISRLASGDIHLRDASGAELAQAGAELLQTPEGLKQGTVTFSANLAALSAQPALATLQGLLAGHASGEIRGAAGGGTVRLEARSTLNGLVLREGNQVLPVANLSFRADAQKDGHFTVQAPVLLDRAGVRSDLSLAVDGNRTPQALVFDAKLTGEHAELVDALALLGVLGAPVVAGGGTEGAQSRSLSPPAAAGHAFWTGITGQVSLDLKSVTRGKDWTMSGLTGRLVVDPARIQLQKIEADFGEKSRLAAKGELAFAPGQNPYSLQGTFSLTEFDAGRLFKALEPNRPATVEGLFTLAGQTEGQGLTLDDTLDRLRGQLQLTSRQGVFRGLKRTSEKLSVASKAVELGAALGSIFGTDKVRQAAEKMAGQSYLIDQFAQMLGELNYDQLSLRLVRGADLNVQLQDLSLVAPEVRLLGTGQVTYVASQPLLEQPLAVSLAISGRGKVEQLLGRMRELDGTRDELGFARAKSPVTISGTMARPDPMPYFRKMAASKLTDYLTPDN